MGLSSLSSFIRSAGAGSALGTWGIKLRKDLYLTWSGCLGISGFFLMVPSSLARACWGGAGPCAGTARCPAHGSSTPEGSQNHSLEKPVSSCLLQLPEAEVGPRREGDVWAQGTRPEVGMPSLLLLKMEEGGAKNQHQAGLWEGWGVHSAMPPEA